MEHCGIKIHGATGRDPVWSLWDVGKEVVQNLWESLARQLEKIVEVLFYCHYAIAQNNDTLYQCFLHLSYFKIWGFQLTEFPSPYLKMAKVEKHHSSYYVLFMLGLLVHGPWNTLPVINPYSEFFGCWYSVFPAAAASSLCDLQGIVFNCHILLQPITSSRY